MAGAIWVVARWLGPGKEGSDDGFSKFLMFFFYDILNIFLIL